MRVLVQRSKNSNVKIDGKIVGEINSGLVLLVCFTENDNNQVIDKMVNKIIKLRIFNDEAGIMNKSLLDVSKEILSISQFTLYADTKKGNRPSYTKALNGNEAIKLYDLFNEKLRQYVNVETGKFGRDMEVNIINDGPVTIMLEMNNE